MMLDARIGLDGARNRSDVIRQAIQQFLNGQPLVQGMDSIRIPLGHGDKRALGLLYELQGTTPEIAAQEGLSLYICKRCQSECRTEQATRGFVGNSQGINDATRRIPRVSG